MVIVAFSINNKEKKVRFFEIIFLLANISSDMVLGMFFLTLSNTDVRFLKWQLLWQTFITVKALPTARWIEVINWKEFATAALDNNKKAFIVHVTSFSPDNYHKV